MAVRTKRLARSPATCWLLALCIVACGVAAHAQTRAATEPELRAAFLYKFAKFTEWPVGHLAPMAPLVFCVMDPSVAQALEAAVAGRSLGEHPLVVTRVKIDGALRGCAVLYVGALDQKKMVPLLVALHGTSVMLIGDTAEIVQRGGVMRLFVEDGQMRIAVNVDAADRARLHLSSQLLMVARIVRDGF